MTSMLAELLGAVAEEIRASLPIGLAAANDEDSQRLFRDLSDAGLLDHSDLIALLLRRADEERIANAIRSRSNPRGGFLQALIADENEAVSASAMALILARGRRRNATCWATEAKSSTQLRPEKLEKAPSNCWFNASSPRHSLAST